MPIVYEIRGSYRGRKVTVDSADGKREAIRLLNEYRLAFGPSWRLWLRKVRSAA
jgi:hypothetical protein